MKKSPLALPEGRKGELIKEIRQQHSWERFPNVMPGGLSMPDDVVLPTKAAHMIAMLADSKSAMKILHMCWGVHGKVTNATMEKVAYLVSLHGVEEYSAILGEL